jgi:hypothetical protein
MRFTVFRYGLQLQQLEHTTVVSLHSRLKGELASGCYPQGTARVVEHSRSQASPLHSSATALSNYSEMHRVPAAIVPCLPLCGLACGTAVPPCNTVPGKALVTPLAQGCECQPRVILMA